ncbi:MAG: OmpA family protein [Caulobacterales bacterium]|nr:OmpA family protein [Caulobacterales bacterium]
MKRIVLATGVALAVGAGLAGCASMQGMGHRLVRTPPACQDITVPVYFDADAASLTPEGRKVIAAAAQQARGCRVVSVSVVGLADAAGDPAANFELSRKRTASVAEALIKARLPAPTYDLTAAGQAGAVTADGKVQPVRRRADITLRLAKPK